MSRDRPAHAGTVSEIIAPDDATKIHAGCVLALRQFFFGNGADTAIRSHGRDAPGREIFGIERPGWHRAGDCRVLRRAHEAVDIHGVIAIADQDGPFDLFHFQAAFQCPGGTIGGPVQNRRVVRNIGEHGRQPRANGMIFFLFGGENK